MQDILKRLEAMTVQERQSFLTDNATSISHNESYMRPLSPEEITAAKSEYTDLSIQRQIKEEVLKQIQVEYKAEIEPIKEEQQRVQQMVRRKAEEMRGNLFYFADYELGMMTVVDLYLNVIEERKLLSHEKQKSFLHARTGTND